MKRLLVISTIIMIVFAAQAQEKYFMDGLLADDGTYDKLPTKKELVTKGYENLPSKYSLKQYCPGVKSQSHFGTCTGWATVYAARTIAEAIRQGWTDQSVITKEAFSPLFVYAQIKEKSDDNCERGSFIFEALKLMKEKGVVKLTEFDYLCASNSDIDKVLLESAESNKMETYTTLFSIGEKNSSKKINVVKKSLAENHPVVISMWLDKASFPGTKTLLNLETVDEYFPRKSKLKGEGYHAMCVIGYDDNMYGGAFQIMNSWGTGWGEKGFFWAKYADFARTVDQAYEFTLELLPKPKPEPIPVALNEFAAKVEMKRKNGCGMNPTLDSEKGLNFYRLYGEVHSGDSMRMYISNNEQAYVYVFSSDLKNNVNELFPCPYVKKDGGKIERKNYSPALTYHSNYIALPDEEHSILIDNTKGIDYWCVLYSKEELDFNEILQKIKTREGTFYEKVRFALGDKIVPKNDIRFVMNKIEFSARSEKVVVPVIIEAVHN